jgi:hydrogenase expression/formation protein HypE
MCQELIADIFLPAFDNPWLKELEDGAVLVLGDVRLAFSTDSFVVDPLFFPGGDIGELAVNGTVNDLAMMGARPQFMSLGFILEEGFPIVDLRRIVDSIRRSALRAGVTIATGDTKVVGRGKGDKIFINTTGIGTLSPEVRLSPSAIRSGDVLLVNGPIADHGMAVLSKREGLAFDAPIGSDTAPLNELVEVILEAGGEAVHALRDPTRGGLASTLNEFAVAARVGIRLREADIPVRPPVAGACEFLGIDPLHVANEGKLVAAVSAEAADRVLIAMRSQPLGRESVVIGEVVDERPGMVTMTTRIGGHRIVDMAVGEQLPRIC